VASTGPEGHGEQGCGWLLKGSTVSQESDVLRSVDGRKVLIFTATAGGVNDACAQAIRTALEGAGHQALVLDGLEVMSRRLKWFQVDFYAWQLEHTPWTYAFGFWILGINPVPAIVRFLIGFLWGDKLLKCIAAENPDVVVSTYPVITGGLGRLVANGRLNVPVVAAVSDFGAHPMWVSPQVNLHLVLCDKSRELVEKAGGYARVMNYPVSERFHIQMSKAQARALLGLPPDAVIPLIVGGTWGVGDIDGSAAASVAAGASPIVVTAGNSELKSSLEQRYPGQDDAKIYGWTNEMPTLMAAADCLIQNACGVT
jgi:processive 1,2-diacylglycerol beta-glucosyltransferase